MRSPREVQVRIMARSFYRLQRLGRQRWDRGAERLAREDERASVHDRREQMAISSAVVDVMVRLMREAS